jgi:hypothetical protein
MRFDPCNCSLKIWDSIKIPTPKMGAHLGVWGFLPSHSPTFPREWDVTPGVPSWHAPLQTLALVASPRLRLRHMHWCIHLSPIPPNPNLQTLECVHSSPTRSMNMCFIYKNQEIKKCVKSW